jgi:hypothetical protein
MKFLSFVIFLVLSLGISAHAKRLGPKPVKSVSHAGLRYEAPPWGLENKQMKQNGGYVKVVNIRNGWPICTKQVYETKHDKGLESDVQDNFITELKINGDYLVINSEKLSPISKPIKGFCD